MSTSYYQESKKLMIERRRKALEEAGLMDTPADRDACEKLLAVHTGRF